MIPYIIDLDGELAALADLKAIHQAGGDHCERLWPAILSLHDSEVADQ